MIKKLIAIFTVLICTMNIVQAQTATHRDSIRSYYELINKAELAIVDSAYANALSYYKNASKYKWLNADDLYDAGIVAYLAKDTTMSIYFLNALAAYGLQKKDFEARLWGQKIRNDSLYKYIAAGYYAVYNKSTQNNTMAFYGEKMIAFMVKDQKVRGLIYDKSGRPTAPAPPDPNRGSSDHENAVAMLHYVTEFGFPSFKQTGFYDTKKAGGQSGTYWFLWWHRCPDSTLKRSIIESRFRWGLSSGRLRVIYRCV